MDRAPRHQAMVDFPQYKKREYVVLEEDHIKVETERDALLAFALEVMRNGIEAGALDGCDIQDMAVKHGLMTIEDREDRCSDETCACAEYGFPAQCYRIKPELLAQEVKP
ncbi:hypothetical protein M2318_005113 [Metapseudomonas resinovorans]|uniref:hypothetical protein n=1 Tax=Metapseudomonas resinovorans TaxID=53412 RepID=UPI003D20C88E